jgi:hypothetical protein
MTRVLVCCLVLLFSFWMIVSIEAEDAGSITLDFTQFIGQMKIVNQSERPSYGAESTATLKSHEFTSISIGVVKVEDGIETTCWKSNVTTLDNITLDLVPGTYKVYTQLEGDNTVLEYNNDSDGYVITPQSHIVIPMAYPPYTEGYILDIPWRIEDSEMSIPILAVDTGVDWADIYNINVYDHNDGDRFVTSTNWNYTQPIYLGDHFFHLFNINKSSFVQVGGMASIRIKFELHLSPDNWEGPVNVKISQYDIPKMVDWYCGDTHQHTNYTDNAVEFGAPIYATRAANKALGLDWMIVTDHSFDLNPDKWNVSSSDCDAHSDNYFSVIQGEEVSCYLPGTDIIPWQYQYNHLLVYGADFIPGGEWEDGTGSDYTPTEAIAIANSQGGITYLAHPFYDDAFRDPWRNEDYNLPFTGLQIWNHLSDEPTHLPAGLAKWTELLLSGRHVYVEGGTDAHGDFNTIAGKVKTSVHVPGYSQSSLPPRSEILNALRNGHSIMSDGPLVVFDINGELIGNNVSLTNGTNATLHIQWNSTPEFGFMETLVVKKGIINETEETNFCTISYLGAMEKNNLSDDYNLTIAPNKSCYYRIEAISKTDSGENYKCFTNPIWVNVVNDTTAPEVIISSPLNGSVFNVSNVTVTGYATDDVGIVRMCYGYSCEAGGAGGCLNLTNISTNVSFNYTQRFSPGWSYRITVGAIDRAGNSGNASVMVLCSGENIGTIFDTGSGSYPSISGTHNGTIMPFYDIFDITKLYTYPCPGTGGHTEYVKIWNSTDWNVTAMWNGYVGDWHNITFNNSFTLYANETYNYTIRTGSYPQIHHNRILLTESGWINCTEFTDANGVIHDNWIPAVKFFW